MRGRVATTAYDGANRISTVQDVFNGTTSTHASSINYWPNRVIQTAILGHQNLSGYAITDSTTLNSRLQVSNRSSQVGSVFPVQLNFTYGAAGKNSGNLTGQQIQTIAAPNPPCLGALPCSPVSIPALNVTHAYGYDAYNRVLSALETGGTLEWAQSYLYDQSGNRAVQSGSYIPNTTGTPTAVTQFTNNRWMGTGAAYDASRNATSIPGLATGTFAYDAENRALTASVGGSGTTTYVYDGEGRRVQKTTSPRTFTSNYIYDSAGRVVQETTIPGSGFPTDAPFSGTEYLIQDHLGSNPAGAEQRGAGGESVRLSAVRGGACRWQGRTQGQGQKLQRPTGQVRTRRAQLPGDIVRNLHGQITPYDHSQISNAQVMARFRRRVTIMAARSRPLRLERNRRTRTKKEALSDLPENRNRFPDPVPKQVRFRR